MDIIQQFRQLDKFFHIKRIEKVLFWGSSLFLFVFISILRECIPIPLDKMQDQISVLWFLMVCMTAFLINYQLSIFQKKKLNWLKMMGLSNFSIFSMALYDCRLIWVFTMCVFSVINYFYIAYSTALLFLAECVLYCYLLAKMYYIRVSRMTEWKSTRVLLTLKRIVVYLLTMFWLIMLTMGDYIGKLLHIQDELREIHTIYCWMLNGIRSVWGVTVFCIILISSWVFYFCYIYGHELYEESGRIKKKQLARNQIRDWVIRFRGKRWLQLVKINYIQFRKNKNNVVAKTIFMFIWLAFIIFCKNPNVCFQVGTVIIALTGMLVIYRIQDDIPNRLLYESVGITLIKQFWIYCVSSVVYLFNIFILLMLVGVIRGSLSILHVVVLMLWMVYEVIYFVSFNFHFIFVRKVNAESPFYEMFELFVGTIIGGSPLSLIFPCLFYIETYKKDSHEKLRGEDKAYDDNRWNDKKV